MKHVALLLLTSLSLHLSAMQAPPREKKTFSEEKAETRACRECDSCIEDEIRGKITFENKEELSPQEVDAAKQIFKQGLKEGSYYKNAVTDLESYLLVLSYEKYFNKIKKERILCRNQKKAQRIRSLVKKILLQIEDPKTLELALILNQLIENILEGELDNYTLDNGGLTPLMRAVIYELPGFVEILVTELHAPLFVCSVTGNTAPDLANSDEMKLLLLNHVATSTCKYQYQIIQAQKAILLFKPEKAPLNKEKLTRQIQKLTRASQSKERFRKELLHKTIKALLFANKIKQGYCDVNSVDEHGRTALQYAVLSRRLDIIKFLVTELHATIRFESSPALFSIPQGEIYDFLKSAQISSIIQKESKQTELLSFGHMSSRSLVDMDSLADWLLDNHQTPLAELCSPKTLNEIVEFIKMREDIEKRAEEGTINELNRLGYTMLMYLADRGYTTAVQNLVENLDANPSILNAKGESAASLARRFGHLDIVEYLSKKKLL